MATKVKQTNKVEVKETDHMDKYVGMSFVEKAKTYKKLKEKAAALKEQLDFLNKALIDEFSLQPTIEKVDEVSEVVKISDEKEISQVMVTHATKYKIKKDKFNQALVYFKMYHLDEKNNPKFVKESIDTTALHDAVDEGEITKKVVKSYVDFEPEDRLKVS